MDQDILPYTVLVYEQPGCGVWVKLLEFGVQRLAEDWEDGLDVLEEHLSFVLGERRRKGECVPERLVRTVKHVGKEEYGPTQIEIEERRQLEELVEEEECEAVGDGKGTELPVVALNVRSNFLTKTWVAELPGIVRGTIRERSVKKLMIRARVAADRHFGYGKRDEREGKPRPYAAYLHQPIVPMCLAIEGREAFEAAFSSVSNRAFLMP